MKQDNGIYATGERFREELRNRKILLREYLPMVAFWGYVVYYIFSPLEII